MTGKELSSDPASPTGQFEFKIKGLISEHVSRDRRHSLKKLLGLVEKHIIMDVLHRVNGSQRAAGRILGIKNSTLGAKLKRYGIRIVRRFDVHS